MTHFALFRNGKQISKAHSSRLVVIMEAYERGYVTTGGIPDFPGDVFHGDKLDRNVKIEPVDKPVSSN